MWQTLEVISTLVLCFTVIRYMIESLLKLSGALATLFNTLT